MGSIKSIIVWIVILLPIVFFLFFFGLALFVIALPFVPPAIAELIYGYKTPHRGLVRILVSLILGALGGLWFLFFARGFCGIDGGSPCDVGIAEYAYSAILGVIVSPFIVYVGVFVRYLFKDKIR